MLEEDPHPNGVTMGKPLFSCGYVNFAWGKTAFGHVIDDQGRIWFYDLGRTWSPRPTGRGLYSALGLTERFNDAVLQSRRVPLEQLASMQKKAEVARGGKIDEQQVMADAGDRGCEAYLWEKADAYRRVELGSSGDTLIRNSSAEAGELKSWLEKDLGMGVRPEPRRR